MKPTLLVALAVSLFAADLRASCGFQLCPMHEERRPPAWTAGVGVQEVNYDLPGVSGIYTQLDARAEYSGRRFFGGIVVPYVWNSPDAGAGERGFGNPVLIGEYALTETPARWSLGSQLELDLGDDAKGLAGSHAEWLPYVSASFPWKGVHLYGRGGFRWSLSDSHSHGTGPLLVVNPHEDKEILYRAGLSQPLDGAAGWDAYLDGRHALESDTAFLAAGAALRLRLDRRSTLRFSGELPVSRPRLAEWRAGAGVDFRL